MMQSALESNTKTPFYFRPFTSSRVRGGEEGGLQQGGVMVCVDQPGPFVYWTTVDNSD